MAHDPIAAALKALQGEKPGKAVGVKELRRYQPTILALRDRFTLKDLANHLTSVFNRPVHAHTLVNLLRDDRNHVSPQLP